MCSKEKYDKWVNGDLVWGRWDYEFFDIDNPKVKEDEDREFLTYEQFNDWEYMEFETFKKEYRTDNGETVVAFGYYGHD